MVVPVELNQGVRQNTNNIVNYINKIPCDAHELNKPSEAAQYVEE